MKTFMAKTVVCSLLMVFFLSGCDCGDGCCGCSCCEHDKKEYGPDNCECPDCDSSCKGERAKDTRRNVDATTVIIQGRKDNELAKQKADSGLEWEVLQEGTGASPEVGKTVVVHYTGWLNENGEPGKKFDSSVDRGQTFSFRIGVGMVIRGWDEGVMGMKIGEKRRLYIPADLGYGSHGAGSVIPPDASLIFDVELFSIA